MNWFKNINLQAISYVAWIVTELPISMIVMTFDFHGHMQIFIYSIQYITILFCPPSTRNPKCTCTYTYRNN